MLKQWVGITYFENHLITIRQMRPDSTGDAGEEGFKNFGGMIFQIIKDPALRADISRMIDLYLADPFSEDSVQATGAVSGVLVWGVINDNQTPNWQNVDDSQTQNWVTVNDGNTVVWTQIST